MQIVAGAEALAFDGGPVAIVLGHDLGGSPGAMAPLAQALAGRGLSVRVPRLPGHGTSLDQLERVTWSDWYAELDAAVRDVADHSAQVFVGGAGAGATLAAMVALSRPSIDGLVAIDPYLSHGSWSGIQATARTLRNVLRPRPVYREQFSPTYTRIPLHARREQLRLGAQVSRDLADLTMPVLLLRSLTGGEMAESADQFRARVSSASITDITVSRGTSNDQGKVTTAVLDFVAAVARV